MAHAITVKVLNPTNTKGLRIKAYSILGYVVLPWDYEVEASENRQAAVEALLNKLNEDQGVHYQWKPVGPIAEMFDGHYVQVIV